jgi:hypothetical protein
MPDDVSHFLESQPVDCGGPVTAQDAYDSTHQTFGFFPLSMGILRGNRALRRGLSACILPS